MPKTDADESSDRKKPSVWILLLAALPITTAIWQMSLAYARGVDQNHKPDWTIIGAQGDWWGGHFGAAAALSSAILFFYAVWLQHTELQATREELRLARNVHESQKEQLERQADIAEKAAIRSHLIDIIPARKPLLSALLSELQLDSFDQILAFLPGSQSPLFARLEEFGPDNFELFNVITSLRRLDLYCHQQLASPLFSDGDREQLANVLELLPKTLLDNPSFYDCYYGD